MIAPVVILLSAAPVVVAKPVAPPAPPPVECPVWGTRPAGCVEPPLKDRIQIYGSWNQELDRERLASGIIRAPIETSRWDAAIPLERFPAALRRGEAETSAKVEVLVTVAPDDSLASCRAIAIEGREGSLRSAGGAQIALDPALGEAACAIAREHGKFRHGIDRAGLATSASLQLAVHFERQRYDRSLSPAPPPPSRWLGEGPYGAGQSWPPSYGSFPTSQVVNLTMPNWKDFLGGRNDLPKTATVGVLLDFDRTGQVVGCKVGGPSGDERLDQATCAALLTSRNQALQRYQLPRYPIEVRWKKDKAAVVLPIKASPPAMWTPLVLNDGDLPGGTLPNGPIRFQIQLDPKGKPLYCRIVWSRGNDDAFDARSCALALERGRFSGAIDMFGRSSIGGLYLEADWQKRRIAMVPGYF